MSAKRKSSSSRDKFDLCIVGGAGHVGLPLAIMFASKGKRVLIHDINQNSLNTIARGIVPFMEEGAEPLLQKALKSGLIELTTDASRINNIPVVIVTIGTPVDEYLNPILKIIKRCFEDLLPHLSSRQLVILRSTIFPGTTKWLSEYFRKKKVNPLLSFCPERVVQGHAIQELQRHPQIVSGTTPKAEDMAAKLFSTIAPEVVRMTPLEAEFAKLFTNAYRYIQFSIANQFYMIANSAGVDFGKVLEGLKRNYSRAVDFPKAGFAAGPCLFKDTMQLAAFAKNDFSLGNSAMLINEGLILYLVNEITKKYSCEKMTAGLLGMAFKPNNDDIRGSLSYKLKKILAFHMERVLTTDPYVKNDPECFPLKKVLDESDILILCVPHSDYRDLKTNKPVIDVSNFLGKGTLV